MDTRLQQAIATPKILNQASELIRLALRALDDLRQLDESLYERFVASRDAPNDPTTTTASLQKLWDLTFGGLRQLLWFCRSLDADKKGTQPAPQGGDDFDFGDFEPPSSPGVSQADLELGQGDIGDLLQNINEQVDEGDAGRWTKVIDKVSSIEYGLTSQQTEAAERIAVALTSGEISFALGVLDDTQSSASEGVHALVTAVYEAFLPDVNPTTVVPGYLTSLGRALLVRRGVAELASTLAPYNDMLQQDDATQYDLALAAVRGTLHTYVNSVVCRAMRPADRWQMVEFERELASQPMSVARLTTEGLVKYLDSLGSINQREVLVLHDRRTLETMRETLANARQLVDISPRNAAEMLDRAYQAAQRLRGRSPVTDQLLIGLERHAPTSSNAPETVKFLEGLEHVLVAFGGG